jgi:hypothetical protein
MFPGSGTYYLSTELILSSLIGTTKYKSPNDWKVSEYRIDENLEGIRRGLIADTIPVTACTD